MRRMKFSIGYGIEFSINFERDERSSEATGLIPGFSSRPLAFKYLTRFRIKTVWQAKNRMLLRCESMMSFG